MEFLCFSLLRCFTSFFYNEVSIRPKGNELVVNRHYCDITFPSISRRIERNISYFQDDVKVVGNLSEGSVLEKTGHDWDDLEELNSELYDWQLRVI